MAMPPGGRGPRQAGLSPHRPGAPFPFLSCIFKLKSFLILNLGISMVAHVVQRAAVHTPPPVPHWYRVLAVGHGHAATSGFYSFYVPFAAISPRAPRGHPSS